MKACLIKVEVKKSYLVHLSFSDGLEGDVDFSEYVGKGVFKRWLDYNQFRKAKIGEYGDLVWEGDLDFCPDSLYMKLSGQTPEKYFQAASTQNA